MPKLEEDAFDLRVRNLNLKRRKITHEDIEKYLQNLPDESEWAEEHNVYQEENDLGDIPFIDESSEIDDLDIDS